MAKKRAPKVHKDIAVLHSPTDDGLGARIVRFKDGAVYAGEIRPARDGEPVNHHELIRLKPVQENSRVCEVEVLHTPQHVPEARPNDGPARVSNASYRRNWNTVFGPPAKKKAPTNGGDFTLN
jgi:hypothetical protein